MRPFTLYEKSFRAKCNRNNKEPKFYFKGEVCVKCTGLLETCPIRRVNSKGEIVCLCFTDFTDEMEKEYLKAKIKETRQNSCMSITPMWELLERNEERIRKLENEVFK